MSVKNISFLDVYGSQVVALGWLLLAFCGYVWFSMIGDILWTDILRSNPHRSIGHALMLPLIMGPFVVIFFGLVSGLILAIPQFIQATFFFAILKLGTKEHLKWSFLTAPIVACVALYFLDWTSPVWTFNFGFNQTGDEKPFVVGFSFYKFCSVLIFQVIWHFFCLAFLRSALNKDSSYRNRLIIFLIGSVAVALCGIKYAMRYL